MPRSLGYRTDLMLLELQGSSVRADGEMIVVSTPENPSFWWGNFVLAPGPEQLHAALELFAREHADKEHVAIGIDGTDGAPGIDAEATGLGMGLERFPVFSTSDVHPPPRPSDEAQLRTVTDAGELVAFLVACHPDDGEEFLRGRVEAWLAMSAAGHGRWYGAHLDGRLVASLGLFTDGRGVARFQSVDTHPDFRRRGLAGTLVHHAAADGLTWPGVETLVIGADPEFGADRVYRSVGFAGDETQTQLLRRPPERQPESSPVAPG